MHDEFPAVMLGKYDAQKYGGIPYSIAAENNRMTYFHLHNWDDLYKQLGDDIWEINKSFLNQQWKSGKDFYFSHNPWDASALGGAGNSYEKEILHLIDLGVKDFVEVGNGFWKAVK